MAVHNFTLWDLATSVADFCLFPLFVLAPGYVIAWLLDLLAFRRRALPFRLALAIPLSIALCPILTYLVGRSVSMTGVWILYGTFWCGFLVLLARPPRPSLAAFKGWLVIFALMGAWMALALTSLVDLQIGDRLYYSTTALDYAPRTAFTNSISTTGLPPLNPLFFPGHAVLRYHYFWFILCSLVDRLTQLGPRPAMIAGTIWCGIGLMGLVALYLRQFSPGDPTPLRRRITIGILLLGVTGLDIVPTLFLVWLHLKGLLAIVFPSLEWWNEQIAGWTATMLWEPHHLAGLIACLVAFLLLWNTPQEPRGHGTLKNGLVAGLALAGSAGSSIYIFLVFGTFLALWTAITLWKKWHRETAALVIAGLACCATVLPYLSDLRGPGAGGPPLTLHVRTLRLVENLVQVAGSGQRWQVELANFLCLPLNYFLELGIFGAAGWLRWRAWRAGQLKLTRPELALGAMAATSVLVCSFVRSSLIANNDLGWRGFLIAQFVLLLWAADLLAGGGAAWRTRRTLLTMLVCLGAAGTLYDLLILRFYGPLSDRGVLPAVGWMTPDRQLGKRNYALRRAYESAALGTSRTAVVQFNPDARLQDTPSLLYANRPAAAGGPDCGVTFGGDARICEPIARSLHQLYTPAGASAPQDFDAACRAAPIDILVAKDIDNAWRDRQSWVWTQKPIFANAYTRLFSCHAESTASR